MKQNTYGVKRAVNELRAIFDCQWSNGMLPQIRFVPGESGYRPDADDWGVGIDVSGPTTLRTSGITQPPVVGMCALEAYERLGNEERAEFRSDFLRIASGIEKYHRWLLKERDPFNENLLVCLHPWETGTDNSPAFDKLIETTRTFVQQAGLPVDSFGRADTAHVSPDQRPTERDYFAYFGLLALFKAHRYRQADIIHVTPFLLQDVLFNVVFVASLRAVAKLEAALAEMTAGEEAAALRNFARKNEEMAGSVSAAIRGKLWDANSGFFLSYDCRGGTLLPTHTLAGLLPLMEEIADEKQAMLLLDHLSNPARFWTAWPLPSTPLDSPSFDPRRYWSGPSWPVTNWLVLRGLRDHDPTLAADLTSRTVAMIAEGHEMATVRQWAADVMEHNSVDEDFTTPSTRQYRHAWLWDSAIVAASWPLVAEKPVSRSRAQGEAPGGPGFWEYYDPTAGTPLGAPWMTWTASIFLALAAQLDEGLAA